MPWRLARKARGRLGLSAALMVAHPVVGAPGKPTHCWRYPRRTSMQSLLPATAGLMANMLNTFCVYCAICWACDAVQASNKGRAVHRIIAPG